jgi:hypothetical protein
LPFCNYANLNFFTAFSPLLFPELGEKILNFFVTAEMHLTGKVELIKN